MKLCKVATELAAVAVKEVDDHNDHGDHGDHDHDFDDNHQYKYGFSFSMLTELNGSRRNQVAKVNPVSWGHLGQTHYFQFLIHHYHHHYDNCHHHHHLESGGIMMALPAFPGKLKNTSGPDLYRRTCYLVLIT